MKVLIAVCQPDQARFSVFDDYLGGLLKPEGSPRPLRLRSPSIARTRNVACEAALDEGADYLLFLDDDQAFGPDMLLQLLSREKDIISGTYLVRKWPFNVCAFWKWKEPEEGKRPQAYPVVLRKGMHGIFPIVCAGCGCLLISRKALEAIPKPWFTLVYNEPDMIAEDFTFFWRVKEAGIQAWLDLDCIVGHMNNVAIWPYREGEDWLTVIASGGERIPLPSARELLRIRQEEDLASDPRIIIP